MQYLVVGVANKTLVFDLKKKYFFELKRASVQADLSIPNLLVSMDMRGNVLLTDLQSRFHHKILKANSKKRDFSKVLLQHNSLTVFQQSKNSFEFIWCSLPLSSLITLALQ